MKFQEIVQNLKIGDKLLLSGGVVGEVVSYQNHSNVSAIQFNSNLRTADFYLNENWAVLRTTIITEIKGL